MIKLRPAHERGGGDHGWLKTRHTFSFSDYYDPRHMGFRDLRVINEDHIAPGQGFGAHGHRDMEILSYVVSGGLGHKDSMGNGEVIRPHEWQRMSAGTGVRHSEANASGTEPVHLYQIWILPEAEGITPGYEQKLFAPEEKTGRLRLVASREGREESLKIHQNVSVYNAILKSGEAVEHRLDASRHAWLQVVKGAVELNGNRLGAGDGAAVSEETSLKISASEDAEIILFDLA
ncbi:MAG TPA: pirin family protein [Pyrinomonadaceae bacterium]|nr:pirin family protein [Pyrinomonadaceae bacterium]